MKHAIALRFGPWLLGICAISSLSCFPDAELTIPRLTCTPQTVAVGGTVSITLEYRNETTSWRTIEFNSYGSGAGTFEFPTTTVPPNQGGGVSNTFTATKSGTVSISITSGDASRSCDVTVSVGPTPSSANIIWQAELGGDKLMYAYHLTIPAPLVLSDGIIAPTLKQQLLRLQQSDGAMLATQTLVIPLAGETGSVTPIAGPGDTALIVNDGTFSAYSSTLTDLAWPSTAIGQGGGWPPTIGPDGRIYIRSTQPQVVVFKTDGALDWSMNLDESYSPNATVDSDLRPLYVDAAGIVYLASANHKLIAIDHGKPEDQRVLWEFSRSDAVRIHYVVGAGARLIAALSTDELVELNPTTGAQINNTFISPLRGPPVMEADGTIYATGSDHVVAYDSALQQKWEVYGYNASRLSRSVALDANNVYFKGGGNSSIDPPALYAVSKTAGALRWAVSLAAERNSATLSDHSPPAVGSDGTVYIANDGRLFAVKPN
jgi:outer membrane protein assembly factor BamB